MTLLDDLLAVQALDTSIDQCRHRIESNPAHATLAAAEAELEAEQKARAETSRQRAVVTAAQSAAESEVAGIEAKAAQVNSQLYGGHVTNPKDLEALQHELDTLAGMQRGVEDRVIEQMELAEPLDEQLAAHDAALTTATAAVDDARAALTIAVAELEAELADLVPRREAAVGGVDDGLLAQYEKIRARSAGIGAARLVGGRCEGCHLSLPAVDVDTIKHLPPDEVVLCPECGRILVR